MTAAANYLKNTHAALTQTAKLGGYHRKLWAASGLVLQAFNLGGEVSVRDLVVSLRKSEADDVVICEAERLLRAVVVRTDYAPSCDRGW